MGISDNLSKRTDFFISYTAADKSWAEWIAWILEENGFSVKFQAWDFAPGSNFVLEMNRAAAEAKRTLAVVSRDYLENSEFGAAEWAAAFAKDPEGFRRQLVPVRVRECQAKGLLGPIVYIDLVGKTESEARRDLVDGVRGKRAKPAKSPPFPGPDQSQHAPQAPVFPGSGEANPGTVGAPSMPRITRAFALASNPGAVVPARHIPKIRRPPSDLEKRRFVQSAFEAIAQHFEQAGNELAKQEGVDFDFQRVSASQFTAEVFVDGVSRRRCKIWIQNDGITFAENPSRWVADNSYNEMLSLVGNELAFSALMEMGWGDEGKGLNLKQLTSEAASEYLWRCFVSRLS